MCLIRPGKNGRGISSGEDLKMKRKQYSTEFKKEAAKTIIIEGTAVREVSEQLGVPEGVLYDWVSTRYPVPGVSVQIIAKTK